MLAIRLLVKGLNNLLLRTLSGQATASTIQPKPFNEIPGPQGMYQWPMIGAALLFKPFSNYTPETFHKLLDNLFDKYGPIIKLNLRSPCVIISDPKDFEIVFRNEGKYPIRTITTLGTALSKRLGLNDSLANLQGKEWQKLRSPLNKQLLKTDSALHYIEQQNEVAEEFAQMLAEKMMNPEELQELFFRFAAENLGFRTRQGC